MCLEVLLLKIEKDIMHSNWENFLDSCVLEDFAVCTVLVFRTWTWAKLTHPFVVSEECSGDDTTCS